MRRWKAASAVTVAAAAALVLSACSGGSGGGTDQNGSSTDIKSMAVGKAENAQAGTFKLGDAPAWDGTVTVGIDDAFSAYNNQTPDTNSSYNTYVLIATLSGSSVIDGNNKVLLNNDVLDSWDVTSTNPYTVTYKIKPGVKWSDGAPWNCKDYYLAWLSQSGVAPNAGFNPAATAGYDLINSAKCTDDLTFVATFKQPYVDYKGLFDSNAILPAHILEKQIGITDVTQLTPTSDPAVLKKAGDFWTNGWKGFNKDLDPASGPYMITAFDQNQGAVTLEKNPQWIGAKGGPAKIVVKKFSDTKAMATALQNGEIQVVASTQPDATAADTMKGLSAQGVVYGSAPQLSYEHIDMNYRNAILKDKAARQALFEVIQRSDITDKLLKEVQSDITPDGSLIYTPAESAYKDVYSDKAGKGADAAKKTLEADGWTLGADGIYQKNGQRFSVTISHNNNPRRDQTVEIIQSQAKAAGIEIKNDNDPTFLSGGRLSTGAWDIALFAWSQPPFKSQSQPLYSTGGNQNHQAYSDPTVDNLFNQAVVATDEATATNLYQQADAAIANDYASLPLFAVPSMWAFQGIDKVYMQSYYGALWNAGEWAQK
ncbi:peptide/nickel transport system substrate-binding protein [Amycolatopsis bartoniae]|uniref:Peptide ABC transporter substrate-binding protein n=1 Tax=Amycolatopsis bartoniae TaxID=941986 RepID=A0A8H9IQC8_9PSEU|nr:ABC transporter family substrate-binding protein [Amycolatopsis bartoniae]MBB2934591.1 peptide/nickel transport system substrate-binding protein [Amycolatopsis bartoniae]TVT06920.1 ABC transporter family substrate-binding protein [Amycolatopsis bartoniae]GHF46248.1 peptide ABC transporter substrate-binding protein [Amycolatopsis bartoniae]